jgi:hypothetical protein
VRSGISTASFSSCGKSAACWRSRSAASS